MKKNSIKKIAEQAGICLFILFIPCLLGLQGYQSQRYVQAEKEIKQDEMHQFMLIEANKQLAAEISMLSSASRIEQIAVNTLGMHQASSQEIVRVELKVQ